jgi:Spy/CpxP family protein refolding chaperone
VGTIGLAMAGLLGSDALARSHGRECGRDGLDRLERLESRIDGLELDAEKKTAARQVIERARAAQEPRREQMKAAREQMHALLEQEAPELEKVLAQADVIGALATEAKKDRLQMMFELRTLVGTEQWKELRSHKGRGH